MEEENITITDLETPMMAELSTLQNLVKEHFNDEGSPKLRLLVAGAILRPFRANELWEGRCLYCPSRRLLNGSQENHSKAIRCFESGPPSDQQIDNSETVALEERATKRALLA